MLVEEYRLQPLSQHLIKANGFLFIWQPGGAVAQPLQEVRQLWLHLKAWGKTAGVLGAHVACLCWTSHCEAWLCLGDIIVRLCLQKVCFGKANNWGDTLIFLLPGTRFCFSRTHGLLLSHRHWAVWMNSWHYHLDRWKRVVILGLMGSVRVTFCSLCFVLLPFLLLYFPILFLLSFSFLFSACYLVFLYFMNTCNTYSLEQDKVNLLLFLV